MTNLAKFKVLCGTLAFAALTIPSTQADTMECEPNVAAYILTLTEGSDTLLTYTYTNPTNLTPFTITPVTTDIWNITADSSIVLDPTFEYVFAEGAGESGEGNFAVKGSTTQPIFTVNSDIPLDMTDTIVTQGAIGTDGGVPILLQFVDSAAASETATGVPDGGSSLNFLAMSVAGLAAISRFRRDSERPNGCSPGTMLPHRVSTQRGDYMLPTESRLYPRS